MSKSIVLYADDDLDDRELMAEAFKVYENAIELRVFEDGVDLLQHLYNEKPETCLVILDINMPRINGKDTLRILKTHPDYDETPVVLFTTSSSSEDKLFAKHYNVGFVTKPLTVGQMDKIIDRFLDYCTEEEKNKFWGNRKF